MINILITSKLTDSLPHDFDSYQLLSMRRLGKDDILTARKRGIKRYYLSTLDDKDSQCFYKEFDAFWDNVVGHFPKDHFFWRNIVSSKIQEWERSLVYFMLFLYELNHRADENVRLIFIPASIEEAAIVRSWGEKNGWAVVQRGASVGEVLRKIRQEIENSLRFLRFVLIHVRRKIFSPAGRVDIPSHLHKKKFLVISLFYPFSFQNGRYFDPFFKELHNYLIKEGCHCQYLSDCLTPPSKEIKDKIEGCHEVRINTPYGLIGWCTLFAAFLRVFCRRVRFHKPIFFMGCDFASLIQWNARRFQFDFNISSEIFYRAVLNITKKVDFDRLLVIFEGNVFERACIQGFRQNSGKQINAYSHAVIFSLLSLKLYMSDREKDLRPEPDYYLCSGDREKNLLLNIGKRDPSRIIATCAFRNIPRQKKSNPEAILIALDGMWSSVMLLDWLIGQKDILNGYKVRIRSHPNVPLRNILQQSLYPLPENFIVSEDSLGEDIGRAKCVIYRHTSVGMQAILSDIPAIHLRVDTPLGGDPMEELTVGKWSASNPGELRHALGEALNLTEEQSRDLFDRAKEYVEQYFSPPNEERLSNFIFSGGE